MPKLLQNKISDDIAALLDAPVQLPGENDSHETAEPRHVQLPEAVGNSLLQYLEEEQPHRFENLNGHNAESLEQVANAYQRMAVVYDAMQAAMNSVESALVNNNKALQRRIEGTDATVHELRQRLHEEQKAFQGAIQKALLTQLSKMQKQIDGSMKELTAGLESYLAQKENASKQTMRYLWVGIIVSFLLGGISAVTLLLAMLGQ